MAKTYYIYILTNKYNTTFYIGITNSIEKRTWEHKNKKAESFSKKYNLSKLVYFEVYEDVNEAIQREKQLKNWHRDWKVNLIKKTNPDFCDLYEKFTKGDAETSSA